MTDFFKLIPNYFFSEFSILLLLFFINFVHILSFLNISWYSFFIFLFINLSYDFDSLYILYSLFFC